MDYATKSECQPAQGIRGSRWLVGIGLLKLGMTQAVETLISPAGFDNQTVVNVETDPSAPNQLPPGEPGEILHITNYLELEKHEPEILARISRRLNGGNLFLAHPFQCLADLNVELSDGVRAELIRANPGLGALSLPAYELLRREITPASVHIRVRGLFRKFKP